MPVVLRGSEPPPPHRPHLLSTSLRSSRSFKRYSSPAGASLPGGAFCATNEEGIAIFDAYAPSALLSLAALCALRQASFGHVAHPAAGRCRSCAGLVERGARDGLLLREFLPLFARWRQRTPRVSKLLDITLGFEHLINRDPRVPGIRFLGRYAGGSGRGTSDPYLRILTYSRTGKEWYECCPQTAHYDNNSSPVFPRLRIPLDAPDERGLEDRLFRFEAWDWNRFRDDVPIGYVEVSVGELREMWRAREEGEGRVVLRGEGNEFLGAMRVHEFMETSPVVFERPEDNASMASLSFFRSGSDYNF